MADSQVDNRPVNEAISTGETETDQKVDSDNKPTVNNDIDSKESETKDNNAEEKPDEPSVNNTNGEKDVGQTTDVPVKEETEVTGETVGEQDGDAEKEKGGDDDTKRISESDEKAPVGDNNENEQSANDGIVDGEKKDENETGENQAQEITEEQVDGNGKAEKETEQSETKQEAKPDLEKLNEIEEKKDEEESGDAPEKIDVEEGENELTSPKDGENDAGDSPKDGEKEEGDEVPKDEENVAIDTSADNKDDDDEKDEGVVTGDSEPNENNTVEQSSENLPLTEENLSRLVDEDAEDSTRIEEYLDKVQDTTVTDGDTTTKLPKIGGDNQLKRGKIKKTSRYHTSDQTNANPLYSTTTTHITQLPQHKKNGFDDDNPTGHLGRLPPSVMKMSTVVLSARKRAAISKGASIYYEPRRHRKIATWDECMNSRPPLQIDMEGPGPWTYSPRNKPLNETNAPHWSFGMRLHEKAGGGYKSWEKEWFHSPDNFTHRLRYDNKWPTPASYSLDTLVGVRPQTKPAYPSFTIIGKRGKFSIAKRGSDKEPAPNQYDRDKADRLVLKTAPAYSHTFRHKGTTLWAKSELTPAPCNYNPLVEKMAYKPHNPAFTIRGLRGGKRHELGPHTTL